VIPLALIRRSASLLLLVTIVMLGPAAAAQAISDHDVLAHVNDVRARMGLATLAWDRATSAGCRTHGIYLALNPGEYFGAPHQERPRLAGFSLAGRRAAATSGLNHGELRFAGDTVYGHGAAWHNMLAFDPEWTTLHRGFQGGYDCIGGGSDHFTSAAEAQPNRLWVWPPSGSTTVPPSVRHFEWPYPPTRLLGLADRAETGPLLYVYGRPAKRAQCATARRMQLIGPDGPVALDVIDQRSAGPAGERAHLYGGVIAVVRQPLAPLTRYTFTARLVVPDDCPSTGPAVERVAPTTTFTTTASGAGVVAPEPAGLTSPPAEGASACARRLRVTPTRVPVGRLRTPGLRVRYCGRGTLVLAPAMPRSVLKRHALPRTLYATRTAASPTARMVRVRVTKGLGALSRRATTTLRLRLAIPGGGSVSRTVTVTGGP
jgi:hypothetical protein